ncbi:MAG: transglycosylase SLT domain-containing protein [Acidimicrobiia bacterium]|nr:transglycosylase SLT domain-containing protein [Acidimicrobiia bacterium]
MRKLLALITALALVGTVALMETSTASAQTVDDAEDDAERARQRAEVASGLVDEAVVERDRIEAELAVAIARATEIATRLSEVGADLDRVAASAGFASGEIASIRQEIEIHAVEAYMRVVSSPAVALANTRSIEDAVIFRSLATEVVGDSQSTLDALVVRLRGLGDLRATYLAMQDEYNALQVELDEQVEALARLYDEADADVAAAVRNARQAEADYRDALSAVAAAQAREEEQRRQEQRTTTTTTADSGGTEGRDSDGYLIGPFKHPPKVERWRGLVQQFFPSHRVEQALRILNCESNGDPDAYNPYSGASGLFQFIPSTWATTAHRAGYPDASPFEPEANTASAAWLANRYGQLNLPYWMAWSCQRVLR